MQPTFTTIQEARRWASLFLQKYQREARVADLLIEHLFGWSQAQLLAYETEKFPDEQKETFIKQVNNHAETGVPVQHLLGHASFYGREFKVNRHVLIPRPETEELVLGVVEFLNFYKIERPIIADIGTGSGVIASTIALEVPDSQVHAVDISEEALQVACHNARTLQADVHFHKGDFLAPLKGKPIDIIVSNPPYISYEEKPSMDDTVVNFDPELALFADEEGLASYQTILEQISALELQPSCLAFEIGHKQGQAVESLIHTHLPGYPTEVRKDLNQKERMVFAIQESMTRRASK